MNTDLVSAHVFLYYELTGRYVLESMSKFYNGPIFLSLVKNNPVNDLLINYASSIFEKTYLLLVDQAGTDQYGFFHSFQRDDTNKPWVFYCHDKSPNKKQWLVELMEIYNNIEESVLLDQRYGIISSSKHKHTIKDYKTILNETSKIPKQYRKGVVQALQTLLWLNELQSILAYEFNLENKDLKYSDFSAGNIFLIRRDVLSQAHNCVHENMFNKNVYRTDGEVEHGLERFYFYVSQCMGYENLYIGDK